MKSLLQVLAVVGSLACTAMANGDDKAKPNTLTPKEIADGWILLFDGETTFGWKVEGDAKVADGVLVVGGAKDSSATPTTEFGDFELRIAFRAIQAAPTGKTPSFGWKQGSSVEGSPPGVRFGGENVPWVDQTTRWEGNTRSSELRWAGGGTGRDEVSGTGIATRTGRKSFKLNAPAGCKMMVRDVKLRPLGQKPIFNGKDLTGWKEISGRKSVFTVTDKGELNIKNGNGDIQTEGQWDDFILQMDIISNGKHLNSGVFFRAIPGEFWSGYESQIRNQWTGDDRTKPVDYGTGGIYNRQPARRVVSTDNEWFTKTIIAHGNHMAVWVNGIQVSDFTDTRPANKSARNGSKVEKGPISLQGHDPSTDLSFRNIRLAELPKTVEKK